MKLLIITQKVDSQDPVLGFFHDWIGEFAKKFFSTAVICLQKGKLSLPLNIEVMSLGKEEGQSRIKYIWRFYRYIWIKRHDYDSVFVHMNQEYVLLGSPIWLLLGKKIFMWRNHHSGSVLTDIASLACTKVFCTSKYSYTAKYKKTILMPVGVNTKLFKLNPSTTRQPNSFLFLGRISRSKNVGVFVEALGLLKNKKVIFTASIYGDALPKDVGYLEAVKFRARKLNLEQVLRFSPGLPHSQTIDVYNRHEFYVNLSSSGMYDKTIFEAMACGCLVLASNENLKGQIDDRLIINKRESEVVAKFLETTLSFNLLQKEKMIQQGVIFSNLNNLQNLANKVYLSIKS